MQYQGITLTLIPLQHYITLQIRCTLQIFHYKNSAVSLRPQTAKANRSGRSYTQSVVKLVIKYNNIRLKE